MCLAVAERVELDVRDDGIGIASAHPPGVGLATMRERAGQLGGTLAITAIEPHGTRVHASLPVGGGVMPIRVIVVDDHPIFRLGLGGYAERREMDGIDIVGEASTASEVADLIEAIEPDIVLLDLHLPDGSGLEVNRWIARERPNVKVVVLTMSEDHHATIAAVRDGARGYIVKGADPRRVEHVIRSVIVVMSFSIPAWRAPLPTSPKRAARRRCRLSRS